MIRVAAVRPESIAASMQLEAGTALLRVNGEPLRDSLDLLFYQGEERLELEAETRDGRRVVYEIDKQADESLGIVPEPDKIRRCTNACAFCFVKGNPKAEKLRASLYVKDDDYRLSFLYGHYVTLTNLREDDWSRIAAQRLTPLYVSVHATDPDARLAMLKNPRAADIDRHLDRLQAAGIDFHAQVVLCPGLSDGSVLQRTIDDLYGRGPGVLSLSVVPVGLTEHNAQRGVRAPSADECRAAMRQIDGIREQALRERGRGWCYAADELFLRAGEEVPGRAYFDTDELVANGVGGISELRDEVRRALPELPRQVGRRIVLLTGASMAPSLAALAHEVEVACGARLRVAAGRSSLFGSQVTSAGLLAGQDYRKALAPYADHDLALFSRSALNDDGLFLDDTSLAELREAFPKLEIRPSDKIVDVLGEA